MISTKRLQVFVLAVAWWLLFINDAANINAQSREGSGRMMFYNVENLFDTIDDPKTDDDDFTPDGALHWTKSRYRNKREKTSWVISNVGEWGFPSIVGLVEVEEQRVIHDLLSLPIFQSVHYDYSVTESPDPRGIDVALLWDRDQFEHLSSREIPHYGTPLSYPLGRDPRTDDEARGMGRNTLWVTLRQKSSDKVLELFVVHAPSRRAGTRSTRDKRIRVLQKVKEVIDDILTHHPHHHIVVMGDFNDNPSDASLCTGLGASGINLDTTIQPTQLYNLAYPLYKEHKGTHRFQGKLWMPDQIIVSGNLFLGDQPLLIERQVTIFQHPTLYTKSGQLHRTYQGPHYTGGYSDHLPIYIDLH